MINRRIIKERVLADLIARIRKVEGWPKIEGDGATVAKKINRLYIVKPTRDGFYLATPREVVKS